MGMVTVESTSVVPARAAGERVPVAATSLAELVRGMSSSSAPISSARSTMPRFELPKRI